MTIFSEESKRREEYLKAIENRQYKHAEEVWHRVHQGTYIRDLVYGANDGVITTFAVVASAAGAVLSPGVVIILGLANLIADGFSMGASNFLSILSEKDFYRAQLEREKWEVGKFPEIEKEEVRIILRKWGIAEPRIEAVLEDVIHDKGRWVNLMMKEELELQSFDSTSPFKHGLATFIAFVAAGFLPLIPYLFAEFLPFPRFFVAAAATAFTLFAVGSARTMVTTGSWIKSGAEMLIIGGAAASVAYGIGWAVKALVEMAI